jgi:hypothetical protein
VIWTLAGFDLSLTGFGDLELGSLLADKTEGLTDPDDAPPVPEHPGSQTGDLWLLGKHRLLCGDSTVATDVERVLGGVAPHLPHPLRSLGSHPELGHSESKGSHRGSLGRRRPGPPRAHRARGRTTPPADDADSGAVAVNPGRPVRRRPHIAVMPLVGAPANA